jgi:tight adherence protein B
MKRLLSTGLCVVVASVLLPLPVAGAADGGVRIDDVAVTNHPDVSVTVAVPMPPGDEPAADAFTLREDGVERALTVEPAASGDLEVVLLVDTSGSMGGPAIAAARDASSGFLAALPEDVRVAIVSFDSEVEILSDFGSEREEHVASVSSLQAAGNTSMYDAVMRGLDLLTPAGDGSGRAIVLLSDGEDTSSLTSLDDVVERLERSEVTFEAVAYGTDYTETEGLEALAEASGGSVADAAEPDALVELYEQLAAGLTHRYTLQYGSEVSGAAEVTVLFRHDGSESSDSLPVEFPATEAEPVEEPPVEEIAAPPPTERVEPSGLSRAALLVGAALWFVGLAILALITLWPGRVRAQLSGIARRRPARSGLTELASRASLVAEGSLERHGYRRGLSAALERAGINLRPGEFVVLACCGLIAGFVVGSMLHGPLVGLVLALVAGLVARLTVTMLADRRQARFADQLGDTLQLLSGSLRAGYGLMQAVDSVAREADAPASEEFGRLVVETRLGRDMNDALTAMAARMESEDFRWVVQAMEIHRDVGGDLAEVLDTVGGTIRERNKLRRQVKALSAEGRMSAWVLLILPFAVALLMFFVNRQYISELWTNGLLGWALVGTGGVMMTAGMIWTTKLVKIEL